jgi:hypothetical protein
MALLCVAAAPIAFAMRGISINVSGSNPISPAPRSSSGDSGRLVSTNSVEKPVSFKAAVGPIEGFSGAKLASAPHVAKIGAG